MNILIFSIPFGFGPTGKAITLATHLIKNHNVTIATFNHSLQIVKNLNGIDIYNCKSRDYKEWNSKIFDSSDVIISIMDLRLVNYLKKNYPNKTIIYFDSLFWWRKDIIDFPINKNIYYILQYFPGIEKNYKNIPNEHLDKFIIINPLITNTSYISTQNEITVHFGGVSSLLIEWSEYFSYFQVITKLLIKHFQKFKIRFVGNKELMIKLKQKISNSHIKFSCLSHMEFQKQMLKSKLFITTCGIESTYEAFKNKIPVVFLPPLNSTQLYQIDVLEKCGFPTILTKQQKHFYKKIINKSLDYSTETKSLAIEINKISSDKTKINEYESELIQIISHLNKINNIKKILKKQSEFINTNFTDGLIAIDEIIKTNAQQKI